MAPWTMDYQLAAHGVCPCWFISLLIPYVIENTIYCIYE